jgi:hypothetical protein
MAGCEDQLGREIKTIPEPKLRNELYIGKNILFWIKRRSSPEALIKHPICMARGLI